MNDMKSLTVQNTYNKTTNMKHIVCLGVQVTITGYFYESYHFCTCF
jgi:hypothetical protein